MKFPFHFEPCQHEFGVRLAMTIERKFGIDNGITYNKQQNNKHDNPSAQSCPIGEMLFAARSEEIFRGRMGLDVEGASKSINMNRNPKPVEGIKSPFNRFEVIDKVNVIKCFVLRENN